MTTALFITATDVHALVRDRITGFVAPWFVPDSRLTSSVDRPIRISPGCAGEGAS